MPRAIKSKTGGRKRNEYGQLLGEPEPWDIPLPFPEEVKNDDEQGPDHPLPSG
jgi:hypothetical protein